MELYRSDSLFSIGRECFFTDTQLKNKVVVITGASSGIGSLIAKKCAQRGAIPVLLARTNDKLEKVQYDIKEATGINSFCFSVDVGDLEQVHHVFQEIVSQVNHIDVLVNNAGFGVFENVIDADLQKIQAMFQVNVLGLIACTKMVLPEMLKRNQGHIINIASQAGKLATPKSSGYSASKHAVLGFTNSLRLELHGTNVHVTSVNPGPIQTGFFDIADKSGNYVNNIKKFMMDPNMVAERIVQLMLTNKRELNLPRWMNTASVLYHLFPWAIEKVAGQMFHKK